MLPVNLGQGAALRLGYRLAAEHGARYVVTLDADGQNDPSEMDTVVAPLLEDTADFVIASRRLGVDQTTDRFRQAGVRLYAAVLNRLISQPLSDSSNGYRAFKVELLEDILPHLVQDQYQTAEVVITAASRGWRIAEVPTVWRPRASGSSKKGGNLFFGLQLRPGHRQHLAARDRREPPALRRRRLARRRCSAPARLSTVRSPPPTGRRGPGGRGRAPRSPGGSGSARCDRRRCGPGAGSASRPPGGCGGVAGSGCRWA